MAEPMTCAECNHFFDPSDERAFVNTNGDHLRYPPLCPACANEKLRGRECWAVWNDCNGIFDVRYDREDCVKLMEAEYAPHVECSVVPVRVYTEPKERWDFREWCERREREDEQSSAITI